MSHPLPDTRVATAPAWSPVRHKPRPLCLVFQIAHPSQGFPPMTALRAERLLGTCLALGTRTRNDPVSRELFRQTSL